MVATPLTFLIGEQVELTVTIKTKAGVLTDPSNMVFHVAGPGLAKATYTYGIDAALVRVSLGVFRLTIVATDSGRWGYRSETGGNIVAVQEGTFTVSPSLV